MIFPKANLIPPPLGLRPFPPSSRPVELSSLVTLLHLLPAKDQLHPPKPAPRTGQQKTPNERKDTDLG